MKHQPQPPGALGRLLAVTPEQFAREHWGVSPLLSRRGERAASDDFADLFSPAAVDELITTRGLRTPFLRLARGGSTLPDRTFTSGGGVGAGIGDQVSDDRVRAQFADGATIVLQGLHRTWEPLLAFSQRLAAELGHPVQVNAYVTPPQNQGFSDHYDVHDVFVLQVHGAKEWRVRPPVLDAPLRDQPWGDRADEVGRAATGPPALVATLEPGDCLYLPRGFLHAATALGDVSIHLTIGVHPWTRHHVAEAGLDAVRRGLADLPEVRASLPLGVDVSDPDALADHLDVVVAALHAAVDALSPADLAAALQARARSGQRPEPVGPLAGADAARHLGPEATLTLRAYLLATLEPSGDGVLVRSRAGRLTAPAASRPALERLLAGDAVVVGDLLPDAEASVALARRLVIEGVVITAG